MIVICLDKKIKKVKVYKVNIQYLCLEEINMDKVYLCE